MEHGPNIQSEEDFGSEYKTKVGLILFAIYGTLYAGFVAINAFAPRWMEVTVFFGINLAVSYGFGLILTAIALGLVYNHLCTKKEDLLRKAKYGQEGQK